MLKSRRHNYILFKQFEAKAKPRCIHRVHGRCNSLNILALGHQAQLCIRRLRMNLVSACRQQAAVDLLVDEPAVVILQRDEQLSAGDAKRFLRRRAAQRMDPLHLRRRKDGDDARRQFVEQFTESIDCACIQHDPVTDGRVHGLLLRRSSPRRSDDGVHEHATDARHEHLQRRGLRNDVVARGATRGNGVPHLGQSEFVIDPPDDAERLHLVARRQHRRHQVLCYGTLDSLSVEVLLWVSEVYLEHYYEHVLLKPLIKIRPTCRLKIVT